MIRLEKIGFDLLTEKTKEDFDKIFKEHSERIERKLKGIEYCRIMLKEYGQGKRTRFSVHIIVNYSGKTLEANTADWDLKKTLRKAFQKIEQEAEHLFHISDQNKRKF